MTNQDQNYCTLKECLIHKMGMEHEALFQSAIFWVFSFPGLKPRAFMRFPFRE